LLTVRLFAPHTFDGDARRARHHADRGTVVGARRERNERDAVPRPAHRQP
jgi:hypothetical protein